jgi:hypothetical protein
MIKQFNESQNILKSSTTNSNLSRNKSMSLATSKNSFHSYQNGFKKPSQTKKKARIQLLSYNPKTPTMPTDKDIKPTILEEVITNEEKKEYIKQVETEIHPNYTNLMNDISVTSKNSNDMMGKDYPEIPNDDEDETFNDSKIK